MDRINKRLRVNWGLIVCVLLCVMFWVGVFRCFAEDIVVDSQFTLKKPNIEKTKTLNKEEQKLVEDALKHQGRGLIAVSLIPTKNDYENDFQRGTVAYTNKNENFSFHRIEIPDGTIIKESNFTQKEPYTDAISGENITFIDCNLTNVLRHPSWILQSSNNTQIKRVKKSEVDLGIGKKSILVSHQVKEDKPNGKFIEISEEYEDTNDSDSYNHLLLRLNK